MNDTTRTAVLNTARRAFSDKGYRGASIRDITRDAGVNLGAVTYHFGSKEGLYNAVLEETLRPFRDVLTETAQAADKPLDGISDLLRVFFEYLIDHPEIPRLMLQTMVSEMDPPPPVKEAMQGNIGLLAGLIARGQADGSIRAGDPMLMAIATGSQPIFMALVRTLLTNVMKLDQMDPETRERLITNSTEFVRRGLAAEEQR